MKRITLILILLTAIVASGLAIFSIWRINYSENFGINIKEKGTPISSKWVERALTIEPAMECVPVELTLYDDGTYELATEYRECGPTEDCLYPHLYTKSIKGTYDFDLAKILDYSTPESKYKTNMKIKYRIKVWNYLRNDYEPQYIIEKGKRNKYLSDLSKQININLNQCAIHE